MTGIEHWRRLKVYLKRLRISDIEDSVASMEENWREDYGPMAHMLPEAYIHFLHIHGYSRFYVDEDLCLMFLPPKFAKKHPLCSPSVLPFAFCEPAGAVSVAFISHTDGVKVHAFDGEEEVGVEGDFDMWMGIQVTHFLRQMASRRISDIATDSRNQRASFQPEILIEKVSPLSREFHRTRK